MSDDETNTIRLPMLSPLFLSGVAAISAHAVARVVMRRLTDELERERDRRFAAEQRIEELREKLDTFANDAIDRLAPSDADLAAMLFREYTDGDDIKTLDAIDVANWIAVARKAKKVLR